MAKLAISLLGSFDVTLNGSSNTAFATDKVRALLAYLAVESGRPHRRAALSTLLWPDRPEAVARNDLRQALFQLRKALGQCAKEGLFLLISSEEVQVNPACDHWLDIAEFNEQISACRTHHPDGLSLCESCLECLERAVELYRGEFLSGFSLPGCHNFDLWQVWTQETCHIQALEALTHLSNYYESRQCYDQVLEYTRRKIELEPWRESAYRRRMRVLAMSGQTRLALQQYEVCREILRREFGITPSLETVHLFEQIRSEGLTEPPKPATPEPPSQISDHASPDLISTISPLYEPEASQPLDASLDALSREIKELRIGRVLSAGQLHRLRKSLRDLLAALEASAAKIGILLGFAILSDMISIPVESII